MGGKGLIRKGLMAPVNTELDLKISISGEFNEKATLDRRNNMIQSSRPSEVRAA